MMTVYAAIDPSNRAHLTLTSDNRAKLGVPTGSTIAARGVANVYLTTLPAGTDIYLTVPLGADDVPQDCCGHTDRIRITAAPFAIPQADGRYVASRRTGTLAIADLPPNPVNPTSGGNPGAARVEPPCDCE